MEFQELSSTDLKCYWKKEKQVALKEYEPIPIAATAEVIKLASITTKSADILISPEEEEEFLQEICKVVPMCALAKHRSFVI